MTKGRPKKEFALFPAKRRIAKGTDMTLCDYCGKHKEGLGFFIGASLKPDWTLVEGTGKITCPDCYAKAVAEGKVAIDNHCRFISRLSQEDIAEKQAEMMANYD